MFDIGFAEILAILVVALVVIGPERMPQVARNLGQWWGRIQRYIGKVKEQVNDSIEFEELRAMERKMEEEARALERSVQQAGNDIDHEMHLMERELEQPINEAKRATLPVSNGTPSRHA